MRNAKDVGMLDNLNAYPRNIWSKFSAALRCIRAGDFYQARFLIESVKYHPDATPEIVESYLRQLDIAEQKAGAVHKINIPADYLGHESARLHPPMRRLRFDRAVPYPYPYHMVLPPIVGQRNNHAFIRDAAASLAGTYTGSIRRVHVVYSPDPKSDVASVLKQLAALVFDGRLDVTVFGAGEEQRAALPEDLTFGGGGECAFADGAVVDAAQQERLGNIVDDADLVLFLTGSIDIDPLALQRVVHLSNVSDAVVHCLSAMPEAEQMMTPFSASRAITKFGKRYPFREVAGLNFAVSGAMLRRAGLPNTRFTNGYLAGRELAFRLFNAGAYFVPLGIAGMDHYHETPPPSEEIELYTNLCPNSWDRKVDAQFEVPKVSVYIPAYNAGKFIRRAVDSVLSQDVQDLDVVIANDGSRDNTLEILEAAYGNEPRVHWVDNANGGIGYASNSAIRLSNSLYIGQLDSDDCLKPGAVRRLMEHLDAHPDAACAYGSCERIDENDNYVMDEYSWKVFSREKMMVTSIAHHFRMFRRQAWERTSTFRQDIVNAVDYDIFLKLCETGEFYHVDEMLYQRRWHGANTSNVNEGFQTSNTYRVQTETLKRLGMADNWEIYLPNPDEPRRVSYKLKDDRKMVLYWPDYTNDNPYQKLLYSKVRKEAEIVAADIDAALKVLNNTGNGSDVVFHLHWLNFLFRGVEDEDSARKIMDEFLTKLEKFAWKGGQVIWTIHNTISHDSPFPDLEKELSERVASAAHVLHFHSAASVEEVAAAFNFPRDRVRISPHGSYVGIYADYIPPQSARDILDIGADDDVILFTGQIRPYKGVEQLISVFRRILADRPKALLLLTGEMKFDPLAALETPLSDEERARIRVSNRFLEDEELQVFLHSADMAVYPYQNILTSGSLLLALSYGVPAIIPEVGMTREVLEGQDAGMLYDGNGGEEALEAAIRTLFERKDAGTLAQMSQNARRIAEQLEWPDFGALL